MTFQDAKNVNVFDLCLHLGAKVVQVSNAKQYALFHAPYRKDIHPSLVVDLSANRWRDFAEGVGGDAVDLVCRYHGYTSPREALEYLADDQVGRCDASYKKSFPSKKENIGVLCEEVVPLHNQVLLDFVASRAISEELAKSYCLEAHRLTKYGKPYYTLAFPTRSGGYELRNGGFKGVWGLKDISVVGRGNKAFLFFEGFFDFLSHLQICGLREDATYIVLNSTTLVARAVRYVASQAMSVEVQLWLDNDAAGRAATDILMQAFPHARNFSCLYAETKDLNDFHQLYRYSHKLKSLNV